MIHRREKFLIMLKSIDGKENGQVSGVERLSQTISSQHLTSWIESVQRQYPTPKSRMWLQILLSFLTNIVLGWGFYGGDFGTDWNFMDNMWGIYQ